jgi:hypothetical protein
MISLPKQHFDETKRLVSLISKNKIADWMLKEGFYAEQYILPPCFNVEQFKLKKSPYFKTTTKAGKTFYNVDIKELLTVSFPKSQLTERTFGLIHPEIYHDLVWHLKDEWKLVLNTVFHKDIEIYSYSFPIPITSKSEKEIGDLRAGRMIYEFIEMAENHLVAEAHKYKYLVRTDVKNCYPSIYTHSIAWALHSKPTARKDRNKFTLLGSKLDKLFQNSNDGCTNGIPIGPVVSDVISEIILAAVDKEVSLELKTKDIDYVGVRFKDDYRFLCHSKNESEIIIKTLQKHLRQYNLNLNEQKSEVKSLPEGLFRPWKSDYNNFSLRYKKKIRYKTFENTLLAVLQIDQKFSDTGIVDSFLSELTTKKLKLKLWLDDGEIYKTFSLLLLLKERRTKSFPQILAMIELLFKIFKSEPDVILKMTLSLKDIFNYKLKNPLENQYDLIWLYYFIKSNQIFKVKIPSKISCQLLQAMSSNSQTFFKHPDIELYSTIKKPGSNISMVKHLAIFK